MVPIKHLTILLFLLLAMYCASNAQDTTKYYIENHPRFVNGTSDTLINAFSGGLYNPQFSNYDLNNDGREDLVVFDRQDHQVLTFLQTQSDAGDDPRYTRAPEYESQIPANDLTMSLFFRDYNNDGRKDLFHIVSFAEIAIYKNISNPGSEVLEFEQVTSALQAYRLTKNDTSVSRLYAPRLDISGFKDIDGDGDMDILAFGISGGYVQYYQNMAIEDGYSLDSLKFYLEDRCWGCFNEFGDSVGQPSINVDCSDYPRVGKRKHTGATMLPLDGDNDGDMDLVYGDAGFRGLTYMENGRVDHNYLIDTFVRLKSGFPAYDKPVDMKTFPALFEVDVNGDGTNDLIASPQDRQGSQNLEQVWYYENIESNTVPKYEFQQTDFLQNTMVDLGGDTYPSFFDYDKDGDADLFVGTGADSGGSNNAFRLVYYENVNTAEKPVYRKQDDDFLGLQSENLTNLAPAFGDLNGNGQKDLVVGHEQGQLYYFENTGSDNGATFNQQTKMLDSIDVGWSAKPSIADIEGDDNNDLLIGTEFSSLHFYKNTGQSAGNPSFKLETEDFGGFDQKNLGHVAPVFTDLNGNDSLDLVLGTELNGLQLFYNVRGEDSTGSGDTTTHYEMNKRDSFVYFTSGEDVVHRERKIGNLLTPAVANLGYDSLPDIMLGNVRGGLAYLGTRGGWDSVRTSISHSNAMAAELSIYPNPTDGLLNIGYEISGDEGSLQMTIYDLQGRPVIVRSLPADSDFEQVSMQGLPSSLYSVVITGANGTVLKREKVVLGQ